MNILGINLDKGIFKGKSASLERLKDYSQLVDKLFIIVWTKEKFEPIIVGERLFVYPTNSRCRVGYYFSTIRLARRIMKKEKIDVVFTQDPFETGLAGWIVSKLKKIPLQIQIHTDIFSPYFWKESSANKIRVLLAKFLIPRAVGLRVVSERIKQSIISNIQYSIFNIFVLPIFVDVQKIQEQPIKTDLHKKYPQFDFIILMASRLTREKNISLAIEAMSEIVSKHPKIGLIIVGAGGEEKNLKFKISSQGGSASGGKNLKLNDSVVLEPWINDIVSYYKSADAFLLTSNYEGYGMAVVEAMAAGCPVIMTDVGCAGEVVKNEENGLIVSVGNKNQLVKAIVKLIEDENFRKEIKERGLETVKKLSSHSQYLAGYLESWKKFL